MTVGIHLQIVIMPRFFPIFCICWGRRRGRLCRFRFAFQMGPCFKNRFQGSRQRFKNVLFIFSEKNGWFQMHLKLMGVIFQVDFSHYLFRGLGFILRCACRSRNSRLSELWEFFVLHLLAKLLMRRKVRPGVIFFCTGFDLAGEDEDSAFGN